MPSKRALKAKQMLRTFEDPILRQVCEPVEKGEKIASIITLMHNVLAACSDGQGLAAPQVGYAKRIILVGKTVVVNPVLEFDKDGGQEVDMEGCLSYPGIYVSIQRWKKVWISGQVDLGPKQLDRVLLHGFTARVAQHEVDHLNGICLIGDAWREQRDRKAQEQQAQNVTV